MTPPASKSIFIIAGEASGDALAAQLVQALQSSSLHLDYTGMGGSLMQQAGVKLIIDSKDLAIVGAWEVLFHLKKLYYVIKTIKHYFQSTPPALLILVDYPGLNLRIAKIAKQYHIPVVYYVSPQIWAWNYKRIYKIKKYVNHMMVLFAFEKKIYQQQNIPVTFVGHPLLDQVKLSQKLTSLSQERVASADAPTLIALLPGSRMQEIQRLLPIMVAATQLILQHLPHVQFVLPVANCIDIKLIQTQCPSHIKLISPPLVNSLPQCQAAIVASGTATLEVALCQTPMIIIYKTNWLTYHLAKYLLKVDKIGLSNIVAGKFVSKELIQDDANPSAIAHEVLHILQDESYRNKMVSELANIRTLLGEAGANQKAAAVVNAVLSQNMQ